MNSHHDSQPLTLDDVRAIVREEIAQQSARRWADAMSGLPSLEEMGVDRDELPITARLHDQLKSLGLEASLAVEAGESDER